MDGNESAGLDWKLRTATEALRKSEERAIAGQFALEIMHEIKGPLEALGHLTYLALEEAENPAKVRHYMQLAEEQMETLRQVTGQTLGFARASLAPKRIEGLELAEAALRIHQRAIHTKKIHLIKDLPENVSAEVHTAEILQVLSNLIVNALDALPENGTLRLRLSRRNDRIHFLVADNGHGIAAEHLRHLFQPFFTTKQGSGTGLGLALSRKIIERHRGTIRIRSSVRPGRSGTTFRVSLPA